MQSRVLLNKVIKRHTHINDSRGQGVINTSFKTEISLDYKYIF